jgi:hypothetical protein
MVKESIKLLRVAFQDVNERYRLQNVCREDCKILFEMNNKSRINNCHFINKNDDSKDLILVKLLLLQDKLQNIHSEVTAKFTEAPLIQEIALYLEGLDDLNGLHLNTFDPVIVGQAMEFWDEFYSD